MFIYRAMCDREYNSVCEKYPLSWNSKCKWFSDDLNFILERVRDGKFNNSKFKDNAYRNIVKYRVRNPSVLVRVSNNELMLRRKSQPLVGIEFVGIAESERYCEE